LLLLFMLMLFNQSRTVGDGHTFLIAWSEWLVCWSTVGQRVKIIQLIHYFLFLMFFGFQYFHDLSCVFNTRSRVIRFAGWMQFMFFCRSLCFQWGILKGFWLTFVKDIILLRICSICTFIDSLILLLVDLNWRICNFSLRVCLIYGFLNHFSILHNEYMCCFWITLQRTNWGVFDLLPSLLDLIIVQGFWKVCLHLFLFRKGILLLGKSHRLR
jgi:hypothetical protein